MDLQSKDTGSIQVFSSPDFGQVRTTTSERGEALFCLADLCSKLELQPAAVIRRLDDGVISSHPTPDSLGRMQQTNFVNEDGLYDVILDSRKPEAKAFRRWITSEVLPAIRKTGGYIAVSKDDTPELIMAKALQVAQATIDNHKQQLQIARGTIEIQEGQIQVMQPKADYTDKVLQSGGTITTNQIAGELGMSAVCLNKKLAAMGVQYKQGKGWLLSSKYRGLGYTSLRTHVYKDATTGEEKTKSNMVWTEAGRQFIHKLFNK